MGQQGQMPGRRAQTRRLFACFKYSMASQDISSQTTKKYVG
ncbi:hypothetical protein LRHMDP2_61 [Lacticaseibacillus rhamnosus LRHMDP2]|nr:hypothetical protein LRHMDP2_61 [Lacticaseibacillus rhamnosus LRHMDP2]